METTWQKHTQNSDEKWPQKKNKKNDNDKRDSFIYSHFVLLSFWTSYIVRVGGLLPVNAQGLIFS